MISTAPIDSIREIGRRVRNIEIQLGGGQSNIIAARYCSAYPFVLNNGVQRVINYYIEDYDTHSAVTVDPADWHFTVPEHGLGDYLIVACISSFPTADTGAGNDGLDVQIFINGGMKSHFPIERQAWSSVTGAYALHSLGYDTFILDEGDTVQIKGLFEGVAGTNITLVDDCKLNFVSIGRMRY